MLDISEVIDRHTDAESEEVDLSAVVDELVADLEDAPSIPPIAMISLEAQVAEKMFDYLGDLFLRLAAELGALPRGLEQEHENLVVFKRFARAATVHDFVRQLREAEAAANKLTVPQGGGLVVPKP